MPAGYYNSGRISGSENELATMVATRTMGESEIEDSEFVLRQVNKSNNNRKIKYMQQLKTDRKILNMIESKSMVESSSSGYQQSGNKNNYMKKNGTFIENSRNRSPYVGYNENSYDINEIDIINSKYDSGDNISILSPNAKQIIHKSTSDQMFKINKFAIIQNNHMNNKLGVSNYQDTGLPSSFYKNHEDAKINMDQNGFPSGKAKHEFDNPRELRVTG
ncbi:hypothetical protein AYI70_g5434 [Smittium culicis]|uniref:Uncharacterized protein n=1 Tax=Smittium culicis TaxID=133412 RepID=A0A1R1XUM0_9FUNG|nr:hypothetical protein AYI70_g5434 [Smittium culicis]